MKATALIIAVTLSSVLLAGCWNLREPEQLALVTVISFDYDGERQMYSVQAVIAADVGRMQDDGAAGARPGRFWVLTGRGRTPYGALKHLQEETTHLIYWAHARMVLLGEGLARRGIEGVLQLAEREPHFRPTAAVAVVEGPAQWLLAQEYPLDSEPGEALFEQLQMVAFNRGTVPLVNLRDISMVLGRPGWELLLPRVQARPSAPGLDARHPSRVAGSAAFVGGRMVGWLDEGETQGWSLVADKHRLRLVELEVEEPVRGRVAVEVHAVRTSIKPELGVDRVGMELMLRVYGHVESYEGELGIKLPGPVTIALQQHVEVGVARLVDGATRRAQALGSDIFGFGELIYRTQPRAWENWEERWTEAFRDLEVKVQVEAVLAGTGLKAEPVRSR